MSYALIATLLVAIFVVAAFYLQGMNVSSTQPTTSSLTSGNVLMSLGQTPRTLGRGITMNYTLTLSPGSGAAGAATVTAQAPQGLSVTIRPSNVTFAGNDIAVDMSVHASNSTAPGVYDLLLKTTWSSGTTEITFHFTVVKNMVLLVGGYVQAGGFDPQTININKGDSILWLSVDPGGDEFGGMRQVRIVEANATSPPLTLYSTWSYAFVRPGTYHIQDPLNPLTVPEGVVIVS